MRFDSYHPTINLIFFIGVIACVLAFDHPVALAVGWLCACAYSIKLNGVRALIFNVVLLVLVGAFAVFYANFTHFGITNLGRNFIGNNYTLESFVVGIVLGLKVDIVLMWLSCMHAVISSDKIVYLFGRVSPRLSLMLSVLLRMVPRIKQEWRRVNIAQKGVGRGVSQGILPMRVLNFVRIASIVLVWLMESAIASSDSMRSRGLGLRHRTAFSLYRFDARDRSFVLAMALCGCVLLAGVMLDQMTILYNPEIIMNRMTPASSLFFIAYGVLCLLPMAVQVVGERHFERLAHE